MLRANGNVSELRIKLRQTKWKSSWEHFCKCENAMKICLCVCVCVGKTTKCTNLRCSKGCGNHKSPFDVRRSREGLRPGNLIKKVRLEDQMEPKRFRFQFQFSVLVSFSRFCLSVVGFGKLVCMPGTQCGGEERERRKRGSCLFTACII